MKVTRVVYFPALKYPKVSVYLELKEENKVTLGVSTHTVDGAEITFEYPMDDVDNTDQFERVANAFFDEEDWLVGLDQEMAVVQTKTAKEAMGFMER